MDGLLIIMFISGAAVVLWLALMLRPRQQMNFPTVVGDFEGDLSAGSDAVLVVQPGGRLIYTNALARQWTELETAAPDLETIGRLAKPREAFDELLIQEARAAFQLNGRWVEGVSHRVPTGAAASMVVALRELHANPNGGIRAATEISTTNGHGSSSASGSLDLGAAIAIVNEMGMTLNVSLGVERVLPSLLTIVRKVIPADAGEICLYDEANSVLIPNAWDGDATYVLSLAEQGGFYQLGEGITGWIAQYRKPLLIADIQADAVVRPKLKDNPYGSFVGVPLILGDSATDSGKLIGTFELVSYERGRFNPNDLTLLDAISRSIATTIQNAQLYAAQARRIEELATLQSAAIRTSQETSSDASKLYSVLTERIARLMDSGVCGFLLYNPQRQALVAELPFYGLPSGLIRNYAIPVNDESPGFDLYSGSQYWISNDLSDEPALDALGMARLVNPGGVENTAIMALTVSGRRIGVIQVANKRTHGGYSTVDMQQFRLLAAQAAVAVEEVRLAQEEARRDAEMMGLQELAQSFGTVTSEDEFLAVTNERIARLMGVAYCGVLLYDEQAHTLRPRPPFYGLSDELVALYQINLEPGSPIAQIWQESDRWYTNNTMTDSVVLSANLADIALMIGITKTMIVAINVGGRRLGAIQISNKLNGDFNDEDARLLLIFASQVGGMIENNRLFRETQRRAEQSELLRVLAERASSILTSEDDLRPMLAEIARLMNSAGVFINVLDRQSGTLTTYPRYIYGVELTEPIVQNTYTKDFEFTVAMSRRPFFTNDVLNDPRVLPNYREASERLGIKSALLVPITVGDETLGEIGVINRTDPPYSADDVTLLNQVAIQAAGALDRIRLYEATGQNLRRRLAELDAINRVSNEVAQTLDVDQVLEVIRLEAVRATDASGSTVVLFSDPEKWRNPDVPEIDRRVGERRPHSGLADIEREAVRRAQANDIEVAAVEDYELQSELRSPGGNARSAIAVPIMYEERAVGVIHLYHEQPDHFDSRAATFLLTLAAKASLSYGNLRRFVENQERSDRLRRRVEQLNQIFELGQMLQTGVETATMLEAIAYSVQQSCGFDVIVMTLVDDRAGVLRRVTHAGLPVETFERTKYRTMKLEQLQNLFSKEEFIVSESLFLPFEKLGSWYVEGMDALSPHFEGNRTMHPHGRGDWRDGDMLLVPITGPTGDRLGVMSLDRPFDGQRPDRSAIEVLEIFAHQAAANIENTRLFSVSVRTAEQEARLNEVIESMAHTLNPDMIVEGGARGIARMLSFNRLTVALLDTENLGYNITRVTIQPEGNPLVGRDHRESLDGTALGRAYRTGEDALYIWDDTLADEAEKADLIYRQYEDLYSLRQLGERTTLVMPLITGGFVLGAMHLGSDHLDEDNYNSFRPLLQRIANLLAVAIQNARLFNQAVNLRLFNESVVQSIQQGIIVVDMDGAILTINEFMRRRFKWDDSALGKKLFDYRPDYQALLGDALNVVFTSGAPQELLGRAVVENGERLTQNFYLYPLYSADSARGAVVLAEDVTYRSLLEANLEQRAQQLAALTEVSSRITASLRRDEVIALALDEMAHIIPYDMITIWARDGGRLVCEAARHEHTDEPPAFNVPAVGTHLEIDEDDYILAMIGSRRPINLPDASNYPASVMREAHGSWLAVALIEEKTVVGVIALSKRETNGFDTYTEQGAQAFANQVAVALVNASLFEEAQSRTARLSLLNRVSVALARSLDTENILEIALKEIAGTLGFTSGRAYLIERDVHVARSIVEMPRGDEPPSHFIDIQESYPFRRLTGDTQPIILFDVSSAGDTTEEGYAPPEMLVEWADELRAKDVLSYVLLPMTVSGQVTGAFELEACDEKRAFDAEKIDLALIIANQAGIAVLNSNLLEQTLVRTRELETLLEAAQATSNTLDLDEVFNSVIRLVLQALEMDDCAIMMYDNVQDTLVVQVDMNRQGENSREMPKGTVFDLKVPSAKQTAIHNGQIIVVRLDDPNADPAEVAEMRENGETARLLVPLIVREQTIGLLQIEMRSRYRTFTHREIRMAQALGAQAATSIENARLSTETAAQVEQSLILNELSRAVSSTMDISDMLRIVRDQVPSMLDADTLYVALYNSESGDIVFPMAVQDNKDIFIPPRLMGGDEVSYIIRNRRPLSLGGENPSAEQVRRNLRIDNGEGDALRYLGVPLIAGDQIVGVLGVRDSRTSRPFGLNDQRILTTIGTQLGAAIQNANLFEQVRNFADEMNLRVQERTRELQEERDRIDALYRITAELGTTLDMDRLLRGALENVARVVAADDGVVMLVNPLTDRLYSRATLHPSSAPMTTDSFLEGEQPFHPAEMLGEWLMRRDEDRQSERAVLIDDLLMTPFWNISAEGADEYRSAIAVVLETQDDAQGALVFLGRDTGQFTEPQLKLVQAAASQVATAINNADLYSLIRDQAERMGTLLRVEQEEAGKNSAILEGIADGVLLADTSDTIILFNNAAERILDLPRDYALGQQLERLIPISEGTAQWVGALGSWIGRHNTERSSSLTSTNEEFLAALERNDEDSLVMDRVQVGQRVVSIRASSVFVGEQLLGTVAVFRDVTKEVEVDRMKSDFIANVTHELRTPLTSIVGYIDLMLMGGAGKLDEQPIRFLTTIKSNAERLRNLVEDLLSISELDSGRGKLNIESIDLEELIMTVASHLSSLFGGRGKTLDVQMNLAPDLGMIDADKVKLTQIISNIVENAFNYTYTGGTVTIKAHRESDGKHYLISVADTGIGIPEAFRSRIWNRFERYEEHALVMDVAGTGLGLPIVKTLVELHGGDVWFDSEVNKGTTFYIRLPLQPPSDVSVYPVVSMPAPKLSESNDNSSASPTTPTNGQTLDVSETELKQG